MRFQAGLLACLLTSSLASGCQLYFNGDDDGDDTPCDRPLPGGGSDEAPGANIELRNPYTGECTSGGGGGGGGGGCGYDDGQADAIWIDYRWPACYSSCDSLDEQTCIISDGCRAIYLDDIGFSTCWPVAMDGPVRGGNCDAIADAFECSQHDDCAAIHAAQSACGPGQECAGIVPAQFERCTAEPPVADPGVCWSDEDCAEGTRCDRTNYCESPPGCDPGQGCPPVCYGKCVPDTDPPPPPPPPAPECAGSDEDTCIDMADGCVIWADGQESCANHKCEPIYEGVGCTCTPDGACTCQDWKYESCQEVQ
jgi:hypothetical protein